VCLHHNVMPNRQNCRTAQTSDLQSDSLNPFSLNPCELPSTYLDLLQILVARMLQSRVKTLKFPIGVMRFSLQADR
jgi:hypothetical protein